MSGHLLVIREQQLELLPQKAIYWHNAHTLIVSDVHLGKASHFRKHGMALPLESGVEDLMMLDDLLLEYAPNRLLLLGDLFHSAYNQEWEKLKALRNQHRNTLFELVKGNHDVLKDRHYESCNIHVYKEPLYESGFVFAHDQLQEIGESFCISGHIHPGIKLAGKGKQNLTLPCFYKLKSSMIMPAFGRLTGLYYMPKTKESEIFVLTEDKVYKI